MTVQLIFNHYSHHASHSGYDQILDHLKGRIPVSKLEPYAGSPVSRWVWQRLINHSGVGWYSEGGAAVETSAAFRMLSNSADIYHFLYGEDSYQYLGYVRGLLGRRRGSIVSTYHQPPEIFEKVISRKSILKSLDALLLVSSSQVPYFTALAGRGTKITVIPHGIDTGFFRPPLQRQSDVITCLCVGKWLRDFDTLRIVARQVAARNQNVRFLVVGADTSSAGALNDLKNISISGRLSEEDLLKTYQESHVMVLPLTDSTANNALLEGLACGLPMVTTDVGGTRDYVDESCAFLLPPGDADGMTNAVLALADDEALRATFGIRSRERALLFDWDRLTPQLVLFYEGLRN